MHSWKHSGFSAHTAVRVLPEEPKTAERVLRYLLRPPVANTRTRTRDATQIEILPPQQNLWVQMRQSVP